MQLIGDIDGALIYDDYGHHPTEIKTTLEGLKKSLNDLLHVYFNLTDIPEHMELDDFAQSFNHADHTIVTDIFSANESNTSEICSSQLVEKNKVTYEKTVQHIKTSKRNHTYDQKINQTRRHHYHYGSREYSSSIERISNSIKHKQRGRPIYKKTHISTEKVTSIQHLGTLDTLIVLDSYDELQQFLKQTPHFYVIGKGSNSIISPACRNIPFIQISSKMEYHNTSRQHTHCKCGSKRQSTHLFCSK